MDVQDEVQHKVAAEVDCLQNVGDFYGQQESFRRSIFVCVRESFFQEKQDFRGGDEQNIHENYGDQNGGDPVVGVHVGSRDAVSANMNQRFTDVISIHLLTNTDEFSHKMF